jgi:hypothetical protein
MRRIQWIGLFCAGCGGAATPPAAAPETASPSTNASATAPLASSVSAQAGAAAPPYDDPNEAADPATLTPLVKKGAHLSFPPQNVSDHECWQTLALTGDARKDYSALVDRCGAATGSIEHTKPAEGRLDHQRDRSDTFLLTIRKGLCYRFFGVADATIPDLDILIERDGSLIGADKSSGPVVIIDSDKAWCMDRDGQLAFHVQVHGEGQGRYVFGAWARSH